MYRALGNTWKTLPKSPINGIRVHPSFFNRSYTKLKGPVGFHGLIISPPWCSWICGSILKETDRLSVICKHKTGRRKASVLQ